MKKNMGTFDRAVRFLVAIVIADLYFTKIISRTLAIVLAVIAVIFTLTAVVGICPLYLPFGINTKKKAKK